MATRGVAKGLKKYKSKKLTGRAKGSTMQKKQQDQRINKNVGKAGSNESMGTKGSFYRVLSSKKAGTVQGKVSKAREDKIMKTGKTSKSSEQKEAIKERKAIEAVPTELSKVRRQIEKLMKISKLTDSERKLLEKLRAKRDALQDKGKKRQGVGSKKVKVASPSGRGKTVTVGGREAKDAARSRLNQGVSTDAKNRRLKEAREKKEAAVKKAEDAKKAAKARFDSLISKFNEKAPRGKKIQRAKKFTGARKTAYEKRKGK
jgi:hypothetical protein